MDIQYKWTVTSLNCYPQYEGETDVVVSASWNCFGTKEVDGKEYCAVQMGSVTFTLDNLENFTPYKDLTEEQVLGWIFAVVPDLKEMSEQTVKTIIENQENPPIIYPPLPWVEPSNNQ